VTRDDIRVEPLDRDKRRSVPHGPKLQVHVRTSEQSVQVVGYVRLDRPMKEVQIVNDEGTARHTAARECVLKNPLA
jgi:hypothetical protein